MLSERKIENLKKKFILVVSRDKMGLQTFPIVLLNLMARKLFGLLILLKKNFDDQKELFFAMADQHVND